MFPDIMENLLENLTTDLFQIFKDFINSIEIPSSASEKLIKLDNDANYFSFNYTPTLEELYSISVSNILYIHNKADSYYGEIILGHGMDPENFKEKEEPMPDGLSLEEEQEWFNSKNDNWDYSYDTGKETLYKYFAKSYKPTKKIIGENLTYFSSLSEVTLVYILGHSLADVDLPYIQKIKESVDVNAIWNVSYYGAKEKASHCKTLLNLGIKKEDIKMVTINTLQIANKQLDFEL